MTTPPEMSIAWDVQIVASDDNILRADVYRPMGDGRYPVIVSYGPYCKWMHFQDGSPHQWNRMKESHPETVRGTSNAYQAWEVIDPEKWVPDGYVCVRVDSRGAGRSPGFMELLSPQETQDFYDCIEWAGVQPWSNGRVGLNGISYYAINQWQVAALQPPHLAAMCAWEGASDVYREMHYHGGIRCTFSDIWSHGRVLSGQHGMGVRGDRSRLTGDWVAGPETVSDEELECSRSDFAAEAAAHPLFDEYWEARVPDLSKVQVPLLSAGNWGGAGLHLRGNTEGFLSAGTSDKWLEMHGLEHWTHFYTDYGIELQKRFFGHFLKGEDTGWSQQPRVQLQVRHPGERFELRHEDEWPLARTEWTRFYLTPELDLTAAPPIEGKTSRSYSSLGDGLTFLSGPLEQPTEITGPAAARLFISSDTRDADLFVVVRLFAPDLSEVTFRGANEPHTPIAHGWLRASRRKVDPQRTLPHRPFHTHDEDQPLTPGEIYQVDVEVWPTSIVAPKGYRLGLSVRGRDYVYPGSPLAPPPVAGRGATSAAVFTGVGPFRHTSGANRPTEVFANRVSLHWRAGQMPFILLPVIPNEA